MEKVLALDEEMIADLNEEVWDLEWEGDWVKGKWEEGENNDWAHVRGRLKELERQTVSGHPCTTEQGMIADVACCPLHPHKQY